MTVSDPNHNGPKVDVDCVYMRLAVELVEGRGEEGQMKTKEEEGENPSILSWPIVPNYPNGYQFRAEDKPLDRS